jgi:methylmalonyl-CoA mutase cobalamin-binding subunit
MRTADQILSPAAREALACRQAARASTLIDQLAEQAQGRDDIMTECGGIIAGSWFAKPARRGEDLIAAASPGRRPCRS